MNKSVLTGIALGAFAFSASLHAATLTLIPQSSTVAVGGTIEIELYMDAADVTVGDTPVTITGGVIVKVEDALAEYINFSFEDPEVIEGSPVLSNGVLDDMGIDKEYVEFGFFAQPGYVAGSIGTFTFTATGDVGDVISFTLDDQSSFGSFYNLNGGVLPENQFFPGFQDASIEVVPIPAAAWLFGSGLMGLAALRRKKPLLA